jgi:hypothetical protein
MDDRGTALTGDWGCRSYIRCHRNSTSLKWPERARRRIRPLLCSALIQRRACGTERATSSAIFSIEGQALPFLPGKLREASENQLLGREQVRAPQNL